MGESYSKAHWAKDESVANCRSCNEAFSFGNRKHHCRNCGNIFCGKCAFRTQPIPQRAIKEAVRVCDDCYFSLIADDGRALPEAKKPVSTGGAQQKHADQGHTTTAKSNTAGATNVTTTPSTTEAAAAPIAPSPPQPTKSLEELETERLANAMQSIRANAIYLDIATIAVEPLGLDEIPEWAPVEDYVMSEAVEGNSYIPFPQPAGSSNIALLLSSVEPRPTPPEDGIKAFVAATMVIATP